MVTTDDARKTVWVKCHVLNVVRIINSASRINQAQKRIVLDGGDSYIVDKQRQTARGNKRFGLIATIGLFFLQLQVAWSLAVVEVINPRAAVVEVINPPATGSFQVGQLQTAASWAAPRTAKHNVKKHEKQHSRRACCAVNSLWRVDRGTPGTVPVCTGGR